MIVAIRQPRAAFSSQKRERGCREYCQKLLQAQVDAAAAEVTKAKDEWSRKRSRPKTN
jgi:hypothetical protein